MHRGLPGAVQLQPLAPHHHPGLWLELLWEGRGPGLRVRLRRVLSQCRRVQCVLCGLGLAGCEVDRFVGRQCGGWEEFMGYGVIANQIDVHKKHYYYF